MWKKVEGKRSYGRGRMTRNVKFAFVGVGAQAEIRGKAEMMSFRADEREWKRTEGTDEQEDSVGVRRSYVEHGDGQERQ